MVKSTKTKKKLKTKPKFTPPNIRLTEAAAHSDLHSSLSDSIFQDSFDKFLGDRGVRRKQLNLKENVDASFNRDSSLECSASSDIPDSSTISHALRPYEHNVCSTPNLKFTNVPILNVNTSDISNDHGIYPTKNQSSDLFASYVRFENSFIENETGSANKQYVLCDESTSKVIESSEIAHNTTEKEKAVDRSLRKYNLRTKGIQSFSRVAKRRKTKKLRKTAAEAILQKENIEECNLVSFCSNKNSTSKLGSTTNEKCQVSVRDGSPGEACDLISFKKPQKLTRYGNTFSRVLRDVKNCSNTAVIQNSHEPKFINRPLELESEIQTTSKFNDITSSALLISGNSSVSSIISNGGALKSAKDLCITNEFSSSGQYIGTQNGDDSKRYSDSTEEESMFFKRLRNNPLTLRSNYENSTNLSNDILSQVDSLPISNTTQSSGGNSSLESNSHGSVLEIRSESEGSLASIANSSSNASLKLRSSYDYSQNSNLFSKRVSTQALLNVQNYVTVRRSLRLKKGQNTSPRTGNTSNELYGSFYASDLSNDSGLQKKNFTSLTSDNKSQEDSHNALTLSKVETIESNSCYNLERKQRNDSSNLSASQYSDNWIEPNASHYDSKSSANSFAGFQTDSLTSSINYNISQVDSLASSVLLQAGSTLGSYSYKRSVSKSNVTQSFGNGSAESYHSLHASNASATPYTGLQDDNPASITNDNPTASITNDKLTASITNDNISQEESLSGSTLTKVESSLNSNSNSLVTMMEIQCNDMRRSKLSDQSKSSNNSSSRFSCSHNNLNVSNEGSVAVAVDINITNKTSANLIVTDCCGDNTSSSTHVINASPKSTGNVDIEKPLNSNISVVPRNLTDESTSALVVNNPFKPSRFLNNLKKQWSTNNVTSHARVSSCDFPSNPVHSAMSNNKSILNPDINTMVRNIPASNTVAATNELMSPRGELIDNTNKLNFVNVTRRKRKQHVNGASNFHNLPAIMESSAMELPESEETLTSALPAVMESVAFDLPENVHSSTCATGTENDFETHRYSVSLHSGKWRRALSLHRKHSLVRSAFLLEQTDVESTNHLKISLSNESNRQTLRHSVSFNLSRDHFVDFNETADRRAARRRRTSVVVPSIDVGRITDLDFVSTYKARDTILRKCGQSEPLEFSDIYSESALRQCRKIGEGVYGEVFMNKTDAGRAIVLKIIPIEGSLEVNGEPQKKFDEILSEIVIALQLNSLRNGKEYMTSSFAEVVQVRCVQGRYPNHLIDLWELYRDNYQTENDHPEIFTDDQLYIVFELANGGQDLEAFQFANALQSKSAFQQMALALAIAEEKLQFEHRDLHWGNILLSPTDDKFVNFKLNGNLLQIPSEGIKVTIIDYTLSRMLYEGIVLYNDLSNDDELFTAHGDYQFDIYRLMKSNLDNDWQRFEPFNNVLWLHYIIDKLINGARYKNTKSRKHRLAIEDLMVIRDEITNYKSAVDSVSNV